MVEQGETLRLAVLTVKHNMADLEHQAAAALSSVQSRIQECNILLSDMQAAVNTVKETLLNMGSVKQEADKLIEAAHYLTGALAISTNALVGGSAKLLSQEADPHYQGIKMIPVDSWSYQRQK